MDPSSSANSRLAVLARQLTSADELKRNDTLAEETRPAPGGGRGTLTVLDNRTGKKYTVRCGAACARMSARRIAELPTRKQTHNRTPTPHNNLPHNVLCAAGGVGGRHAQRAGPQGNQGWWGWRWPAHL